MPNVVVDTHVFIRSLVPGADYRDLIDTIIRVCDTVAVNDSITREYGAQAHNAGIPTELVQRVLQGQELLAIGKIKRTANRSGRRALQGIPDQDQAFVEAARASGAKYLISNDRRLQSLRTRLGRLRIQVVYPHEYLQEHELP